MRGALARLALAALAAAGNGAAPGAPERGLLAFEKQLDGNLDVYVVPAAGGLERRLTDDPAEDALPRFEPDGRTVLFSSRRSGHWQMLEVSVEGGRARPVRPTAADEWQGDPSRDGRSIVFLSNEGAAPSIEVLDRASGRVRRLAEHGPRTVLGNPNWSPDGTRVVFSSNLGRAGHKIYVVDSASGRGGRVSSLLSGACEPRFSRDGRRVAYVRRHHLTRSTSRIVEQDLESGEVKVLVDWPALNYDPTYSPDGTELAFASTIAGGEFAIYRLRLADGRSWRVTFGRGAARHPDYQP